MRGFMQVFIYQRIVWLQHHSRRWLSGERKYIVYGCIDIQSELECGLYSESNSTDL